MEWSRTNAVNIAERSIGESFFRKGSAMGLSKRALQSLFIFMENMSIVIQWRYRGDENEPLGVWFEKSTARHFIKPAPATKDSILAVGM